jgi:DNA-binding NtrC family response regulator
MQPDLIVTDCQMPRLDGIGLLRQIREFSDVPVIIMTAFASIADCEKAIRLGANRYLQFRRDLDGVGSVACELVGSSRAERGLTGLPDMTARRARSMAREELRGELEILLLDCRGNIAEMARRMGRDRSTIRYHLSRLGMLGERRPIRNSSSDGHESGIERS